MTDYDLTMQISTKTFSDVPKIFIDTFFNILGVTEGGGGGGAAGASQLMIDV